MKQKIGVLGLGSMGFGIAKSLVRADFLVYGFDLRQEALDSLKALGAKAYTDAKPHAAELHALLITLVSSSQIEAVLFKNELAPALKKGTLVVLHSTMSAKDAKNIGQKLEAMGLLVLDAPMSGGALKAASGELSLMASGKSFAAAKDIFKAYASRVFRVGHELGQGSVVKTAHQLLAGAHIAVAAEAFAMASKAGINLKLFYELVNDCAGSSWMFKNRMAHVLEANYEPKSSVEIFVKDLGLVTELGRELGLDTPLAKAAHERFLAAKEQGLGAEDDAAIIKLYSTPLPVKKRLGVIADDFTGASDIASFMSAQGLLVLQFVGKPEGLNSEKLKAADAIVISLKTRSCPKDEAIKESLEAAKALKAMACTQFIFKYCSTFDSSKEGNIGPVTDALAQFFGARLVPMLPALPINGRTVLFGNLFVNGVLLNESGMQNHPVTPMKDSNLLRLMDAQSSGKSELIDINDIRGIKIAQRLDEIEQSASTSPSYVFFDALKDSDLKLAAEELDDFIFITGGSGIGGALAASFNKLKGHKSYFSFKKPVILSGSCSEQSQAQVAAYEGPKLLIDISRCAEEHIDCGKTDSLDCGQNSNKNSNKNSYSQELLSWALAQSKAPMLYATQNPATVLAAQQKYGKERLSQAIEELFAKLAQLLKSQGFDAFLVAGGETSGAVVKALGAKELEIGPSIAPGVPWMRSKDGLHLALKSGNFGSIDFFHEALKMNTCKN